MTFVKSCYDSAHICPIRAEIIGKMFLFCYLYDKSSWVSDKITSIYRLILEILGRKCHFFAI